MKETELRNMIREELLKEVSPDKSITPYIKRVEKLEKELSKLRDDFVKKYSVDGNSKLKSIIGMEGKTFVATSVRNSFNKAKLGLEDIKLRLDDYWVKKRAEKY